MDELRGPTIQIVLHVKEGLGFGFLRTPFIVSGSLNGYMLETDPVVPCHAPVFDAELVWEADKRRFRSLRVQNVPIKVEVHTVGTQGRKDKIGYFLLSLLGAQPCPSNKIVEIKHTWHRLLGVRSEGKCCQPQLLVSLSIEDRVNTITPRNELRMFHSNEVAQPTNPSTNQPARSILFTLNEYLTESKRTASSPELQPQLLCDEGLIQIGSGRQLFVLSFIIGSVENLDSLLPDYNPNKGAIDCFVTYSVFTHNITTDRVWSLASGAGGVSAQFNQRTSLRVRSSLGALGRYLAECPHLVTKVCAGERDVGICSMDLRKLVPTDDIEQFTSTFCNMDQGLTIHERCFILRFDERAETKDMRRPYVDVEMTLKYLGIQQDKIPTVLTARSATQLETTRQRESQGQDILDYKSGSCTNLDQDLGGVSYTNMGLCNTARYKTASGTAMLQTNELADMIKKMYESFQDSQEKLRAAALRPATSDVQVQVQPTPASPHPPASIPASEGTPACASADTEHLQREDNETSNDPPKLETSKSDPCVGQTEKEKEKELMRQAIPAIDRDAMMQKFVNELEDWKERQQELFKAQLKRKEEYHLDLLSVEWGKKQAELERRLRDGVEQCRRLAADLARATDDFRLRGYRTCERERKLQDAKKALEAHYTAKYQELRLASQKMEDDMNHQLKLKDMRIDELAMTVQQLEKRYEVLKNNMKNSEKENENRYSGLTKDQTASLIQELRCLEEKLDSAVQSKAFFKEQWGRAVRELHLSKLAARRHLLAQLQAQRRQLGHDGLDPIPDEPILNNVDIKKLKDDFYVDLLAHSPGLESHSVISTSGPDGMEMFQDKKDAPKNPLNEKITELIMQREQLIQQDSPDEGTLQQLNHEIRSLLLNCGT